MFDAIDTTTILDRIFAAYASIVGVWADTLTGAEIRALLPVGVLADVDADADADARTVVGVCDTLGREADAAQVIEAIWNPAGFFMGEIGHPDAYDRPW
jgi:hypothetical protein